MSAKMRRLGATFWIGLAGLMLIGGCPGGAPAPTGPDPSDTTPAADGDQDSDDSAKNDPSNDAGDDSNDSEDVQGDDAPADDLDTPASVSLGAPLTRTAVADDGVLSIVFTVSDPDNLRAPQRDNTAADDGIALIIYRDENGDGGLSPGERAAPDYWIAEPIFRVGPNVYTLDIEALLSLGVVGGARAQFFVAVRVTQRDGRVSEVVTPQPIVIEPVAPAALIAAPTGDLAVRVAEAGTLDLTLEIDDADRVLLPQPEGIRLIVIPDANGDGVADSNAAPVDIFGGDDWSIGTLAIAYDLARLELSNDFGRFVIGVELADAFGRVERTLADWVLTIDNVAPQIEAVAMSLPDAPDEFVPIRSGLIGPDGALTLRIETRDNADVTVYAYLDTDETPRNGNEIIVARRPIAYQAATDGETTTDIPILLSLIPDQTYRVYLEVEDAVNVAPRIGGYVRDVRGNAVQFDIGTRIIPARD